MTESDFSKLNQAKNFDEYYNRFIKVKEDEYEAKRLISNHLVFVRLIAVIIIFLISIGFLYFISPNFIDLFIKTLSTSRNNSDFFVAGFFAITLLGCYIMAPHLKFSQDVKSDLLPIIIRYFGEHFYYNAEFDKDFASKQINQFELFSSYNSSHFEDLIVGNVNKTGIQMFEANLKQKQGKRTYEIFDGLVVIVEANKIFNGRTIIKKDSFLKTGKYERVSLEDPSFEKYFDVRSTDQIEARFLLSTSFMQRLLDLGAMFENKIECSFFDKKLLIAIASSENRFEPVSGFKEINFYDSAKKIVTQIATIIEIIEILKLDEKTGL